MTILEFLLQNDTMPFFPSEGSLILPYLVWKNKAFCMIAGHIKGLERGKSSIIRYCFRVSINTLHISVFSIYPCSANLTSVNS